MTTEFEAKFSIANKDEFRTLLKSKGAVLVTPERLMRRSLFGEHFLEGRWLRLRDEGDRVTLTFKNRSERSITGTQEVEVEVSNYDKAHQIIELSSVPHYAYQENKRESWELDGAQIEIDTWPRCKPHVEVEATSEEEVRAVAEKLGFNWQDAFFDTADEIYAKQNGLTKEQALKDFKNVIFYY